MSRDEPKPWGTAVFVAPGVALTACHVLEGFWKALDDLGRWQDNSEARFAVQALQYVPAHPDAVLWHATAAWHSEYIDIAVLQLVPDHDLPSGYQWPYLTLDVADPAVGTPVQAFGYSLSQVQYDHGVGGWILYHEAAGARGSVTQVFHPFRDTAKLRFPCFEMDIEIAAGMSGGPVFDAKGHLRGIVCSSLEFLDSEAPVSYASSLWPSLALPIQPTPHLGIGEGDTRLLHLARDGRLVALNYESLRLPDDPNEVCQAAFREPRPPSH